MNRTTIRLAVAGSCLALLGYAYHQSSTVSVMTQTANAFLKSLSADQKAKAKLAFEGDERTFWHYIPTDDIPKRFNKPRMGLILADMEPHQRHLAMALLASGLSQSGFIKASQIMSLEDVLRIMEKDTKGRRNPYKYHFSIFGEPSDQGTWGYRVEGHHVSVHFTIHKGQLVGTPTFFGANPQEVREGDRAGLRVLGAEEDLGRELVTALTADQRKTATVAAEAYKDILTEASRKASLAGQPNGLSASKMNAAQRTALHRLIDEYIHNVPDPIAQQRTDRVKKAGNNIYFAWAGPIEKGQPHYYRVVGPNFLIEYDNTQNGANHSHTVWREPDSDFGLDLLAEHYKSSHR
ncbi:MAG: DUF3500 domain-containing protein [Bryobacteraceae bacterium]